MPFDAEGRPPSRPRRTPTGTYHLSPSSSHQPAPARTTAFLATAALSSRLSWRPSSRPGQPRSALPRTIAFAQIRWRRSRAAGRRTPGGMPGAGCCFQLARANRSACASAWDERRRPSSGARSRRSRPPRCLHARAQPSDLRRPCVKHKRRSRRRGCLARAGTIATGGKQKSRAVGAA